MYCSYGSGKEVGNMAVNMRMCAVIMRQDGNCEDKAEPGNNNGENRLLKINKG
jgi:hypothetical protein